MKQGQAGRWRWRRVRRRENNTFSRDAWEPRSTAGTRKQRKGRNHVSAQVRVYVPASQGSIHRAEGAKEIDGSSGFHLVTSSNYRYSLLCPGSCLSLTFFFTVNNIQDGGVQTCAWSLHKQHRAVEFSFFALLLFFTRTKLLKD